MFRVKVLASSVPLLLAALFAGSGYSSAPRACIAAGGLALQLAASPWQADGRVAFTDDASQSSVRVQIVDDATLADFAVVDDAAATADEGGCAEAQASQTVAIVAASDRDPGTPLIYLSAEPGEYRIYVRSQSVTPRDAAALVVGARGSHPRVAAAL